MTNLAFSLYGVMCVTCDEIRGLSDNEALAKIGAAIKRGAKAEHFKRVTDKILGTEEPEVDAERDADWENSRQR